MFNAKPFMDPMTFIEILGTYLCEMLIYNNYFLAGANVAAIFVQALKCYTTPSSII